MQGVKELVKDKQWQNVRKSLLGQWSKRPDWCVLQLRKYLGSINSASTNKLKIVQNYLTGTGFRTGTISSRDNPSISKLRAEISVELKKRKFGNKE